MTEAESLERALHEDISLHPYDTQWPAIFLEERERLMKLFPDQLIDVQHIGSTSIPDMIAKPVIDLLAGVESMATADALVAPLIQSGYITSADFNATLDDRRWLMRWSKGRRTHHLQLVVYGDSAWQRFICFRDILRARQDLADRYAGLKREIAMQHKVDREAYTEAKTEFVLSIVCDA